MNTVVNDRVVEIHYSLKLENGEVIDSTDGFSPLAYIQGKKNIIQGLEKNLLGKSLGDSFSITVSPEEGYGIKNPELIQIVSIDNFKSPEDLKIGMQFKVPNSEGHAMIVEIKEINNDQVTLDGNHPLAGMNLYFDIKIESIREASEEELVHGHLHKGAGCCGGGKGGCGNSCDDEENCK
jgi:FKBP-type peptidyl-prolyl cis-trans isomerase SlyD